MRRGGRTGAALGWAVPHLIPPRCRFHGGANPETTDPMAANDRSSAPCPSRPRHLRSRARPLLLWSLACALTLSGLATRPLAADGEVRIEQDFDGGSLLLEETRIEGDTVYLEGRDNYNRGRWKWIHFSMTGVEGRALEFEIGNHFATGPGRLDRLRFVYSHDQVRWTFFPQASHDRDRGVYRFGKGAPFTSDRVWVAFSMPYPVSRVADLVAFLRHSDHVFPTASSDERLVLGQSPGGTDDVGRTIPPQDIHGFMITDGAAGGVEDKEKVVILSGVHANETPASHVTEGLLLFLAGESPEATELRRAAEFYVYPMVNPDGRYAGYNRGGVLHPRRDTNRFWHEDLYADMPDIQLVGEAMKRDTAGSDVAFFLDFHSWSDTGHHFVIAERSLRDTVFWEALTGHEPDMRLRGTTFGDEQALAQAGRSSWFAHLRLGARHAMIPETMFRPGENSARYRRMGRAFGLALHADLVGGGVSPEAALRTPADQP